jgi:hypothetical protein
MEMNVRREKSECDERKERTRWEKRADVVGEKSECGEERNKGTQLS